MPVQVEYLYSWTLRDAGLQNNEVSMISLNDCRLVVAISLSGVSTMSPTAFRLVHIGQYAHTATCWSRESLKQGTVLIANVTSRCLTGCGSFFESVVRVPGAQTVVDVLREQYPSVPLIFVCNYHETVAVDRMMTINLLAFILESCATINLGSARKRCRVDAQTHPHPWEQVTAKAYPPSSGSTQY